MAVDSKLQLKQQINLQLGALEKAVQKATVLALPPRQRLVDAGKRFDPDLAAGRVQPVGGSARLSPH